MLARFDAAYSRCTFNSTGDLRASQTCSSGEVADRIANGRPIATIVTAATHATGGQPGRGVSHNARTVIGQSAHDAATRIVWRITARRTSATRTSHALYQ